MSRPLQISLSALSVFAMAAVFAACGAEDPKTSRVEGQWTIAASGALPSAKLNIAPTCESGPCSFKVDFGFGQPPVTYKYDAGSGNYTGTNSATSDCLLPNGKVGAKDGITVSTSNVFTPTKAEKQDGGSIATEAKVSSKVTTTVTSEAKKSGCAGDAPSQTTTQTAERTDLSS